MRYIFKNVLTRRKRPSMQFEELIKQPHYKGILELLLLYPKGLETKHFRYHLQKNLDINERTHREVERFFNIEKPKTYPMIDELANSSKLKRTYITKCIDSKQGLSNFLRQLIDINLIKKAKRTEKYILTDYFFLELLKVLIKKRLDKCSKVSIENIDPSIERMVFKMKNKTTSMTIILGDLKKDKSDS